jgi:RHS repeat-associated protein
VGAAVSLNYAAAPSWRSIAVAVTLAIFASACSGGNQDSPTASAPEYCEDFTFVPCARQVATVALSIAGSPFSLHYSSDRAPGRKASPSLDARPIGLGGWTLDVLHTYDAPTKVLVLGTGERRRVDAMPLSVDGSPALGVAALDGSEVYVFDRAGHHSHTFDAVTGAERFAFAWAAAGLESITEPGGRVTRIRRDDSGNPVEIVTARSYRTRLGLREGHLAAVAKPSGHFTKITTDAGGLVTVIRDASNAKTLLRYDDSGRLVEWEGPSGAKVDLQRKESAAGFTVTSTTGEGRRWSDSVEVTSHNDVVRTHRDTSGQATKVEVSGLRRNVTAADGTVVELQLAADPRWGLSAPVPRQAAVTSPGGRRSAIDETRTQEVSAAPSAPGAVRRTLTIDGASWTVAFDPAARRTTITAPNGTTRTTALDEKGRPVLLATPGSAPLAYHYDAAGRIDAITAGTGTEARVWRRTYDTATGTVTLTDPAGRTTVTRADADGRPSSVSGPGDFVIGAQRDEVGRLTAVVPPAGAATSAQLRPDGQVATATAPAGASGIRFTTFDYDADGVVSASGAADASGTTLHRDGNGRVDQVDAGAGPWRIGYDGSSGLATTFEGPGATLKRQFDGAALAGEAWSGPVETSVTHRLDPSGRVLGETVAGTGEVGFGYDAAGLLTQAGDVQMKRDPTTGRVMVEVLGSLQRSWTYNAFGEVIAVRVTAGGRPVYDLAVARNQLGRVSARTEHLPDGVDHSRSFTYDAAGRLASTVDDGAQRATFGYDVNGNLITETTPDGTTITSTYDGRDALLSRGDTTYTYDVAGRLASTKNPSGTTAYAYDRAGALLSVKPPVGPAIEYVNDATGRRIAKRVGGTTVQVLDYRDELRPAAALDGAGHVVSRFVYGSAGSAPTYVERDTTTLLVVTDDLGTPRLLLDSTDGHPVEQIDTDVWGRVTSDTAPGTTPFGFAGGLADPDTGLLRFGARDYDTVAHRWTATDPIGFQGGDSNLYRYVGGDPVNHVDPTGLDWFPCDVFAVGFHAGGGIGGVSGGGGVGLVTGGTSAGAYVSEGLGLGTPGFGFNVSVTCLNELDDKPGTSSGSPFDKFGGEGASGGLEFGPGGVGGDVSIGADGQPTLAGGHISVGPGAGVGGEKTRTGLVCLFGCTPPPGGGGSSNGSDSEKDAGPDAPARSDLCGAVVDCGPDNPGGGPDKAGSNPDEAGSGPELTGPKSWGEPHLRAAGGQAFDLQAVGEFTALRSDSGDLVIQTRQVPLGGSLAVGGSRFVAINGAVAVGINGDRVTFQLAAHVLEVRVNGQLIDPHGGIDLPKGGRLRVDGSHYLLTWPDQTVLRVFPSPTDINVQLAAGRVGTVHGLLGPYTGAPLKGLEAKDGTTIPEAQVRDPTILNRRFGDSWRISQNEALFDYAPGQSTATFDDRTFPDPNPGPISDSQRAGAERLCKRFGLVEDSLAGCIFDVSVTGDAGWAATAAAVRRAPGPTIATTGSAVPPSKPSAGGGAPHRMALGDTVSGTLANVNETDTYTFTADPGQIIFVEHQVGTCDIVLVTADSTGSRAAGAACNDIGPLTLVAGGEARIEIGRRSAVSGDYRFHLIAVPATTTAPIAVGDTVTGQLETKGTVDAYTFTGSVGQVVVIEHQLGACGATIDIADESGRLAAGSACNDISPYTLPKGGVYRIHVLRGSAETGDYRFRLRTG